MYIGLVTGNYFLDCYYRHILERGNKVCSSTPEGIDALLTELVDVWIVPQIGEGDITLLRRIREKSEAPIIATYSGMPETERGEAEQIAYLIPNQVGAIKQINKRLAQLRR